MERKNCSVNPCRYIRVFHREGEGERTGKRERKNCSINPCRYIRVFHR